MSGFVNVEGEELVPMHSLSEVFDIQMLSNYEGWAVGWIDCAIKDKHGVIPCGYFLHFEKGKWEAFIDRQFEHPSCVYMISAHEGWVAGAGHRHNDGFILHYRDGVWTPEAIPPGAVVRDIHMVSSSEGWAVGHGGLILHYDGMWSRVASPTLNTLISVSMASRNEGWAVGASGTMLHYTGKEWKLTSSSTEVDLLDVQMLSAQEGWAAGSGLGHEPRKVFLHYTGGRWVHVELNADLYPKSIAMISPDDGWVADGNSISHYKDGKWIAQYLLESGRQYYKIALAASEVGWAVGIGGILTRYDRGRWATFNNNDIPCQPLPLSGR